MAKHQAGSSGFRFAFIEKKKKIFSRSLPLFASILHDSPSTQPTFRVAPFRFFTPLRPCRCVAERPSRSVFFATRGKHPFKAQNQRRRHDNGETNKTISRHSEVVSASR